MVKENKPFAIDEECTERRMFLIEAGIIRPGKLEHKRGSSVFHAPEKERRVINERNIPEEGTYRCRPIRNDTEYNRRRANYLHVLQSMLLSRKELNLEFETRDRK